MFDWEGADPSHRRFLAWVDRVGMALFVLTLASFAVRPWLAVRTGGFRALIAYDLVVFFYVTARLGCRFVLGGEGLRALNRPRVLVDLVHLGVGLSLYSRLIARSMTQYAWAHTGWRSSWWVAFFLFIVSARLVPFLTRFEPYLRGRDWLRSRPPVLVAASFLVVIATGTLLLSSPQATAKGHEPMNFVDALFTATSAVCVTGLVVNDTGSDLSLVGQVIVLVLIQIGGIGIVSLGTFFFVGSGKDLVLGEQEAVLGGLDPRGRTSVVETVRIVVVWTVGIELVGALLLYFSWWDVHDSFGEAAWFSLFHSVSAFCNAGFGLYPDSLVQFSDRPMLMVTFMTLIVLGGLGFFVLANLVEWIETRRAREKRYALYLHSRLVLRTTALLLVLGTVSFFVFERQGSMARTGMGESFLQSLFLSVTARTAGFDALGIAGLTHASILVLLALMFIGGSPGGTAGGIKTTTAAIFYLALRAMVQGRDQPVVERRAIRRVDLHRSMAVAAIGLLILFVFAVALLFTEDGRGHDFRTIAFEACSAFGTVGLSLGLTPNLTVSGRILISMLMFVGRIGPLTLATAVTREARTARIEFPEDPVSVG